MYYYESQKEWIDALKVMRELEVMPAHVKKHPAYDACLTVERSVRQSMPDILRHLPEEIMLYPRGQGNNTSAFMRMCTNDRYITKLLVNTKTSSRHMAMMLVIDYLQWLFRIECWNVKGKQNKTQRNSPTSDK